LKKRIGCLHAHYSNIEYIENALSSYDVELIHFVDPVLLYRVTTDETYKIEDAQKKAKEQLEWIAKCNVDAILITCTNYITFLQEETHSLSVPIIKIDEPYFEVLCNISQSQIILFTNPATVNGTMERLYQYADRHQKSINVEGIIINDTFDLIMQGQKQAYNKQVSHYLKSIIEEDKVISVAQLSMVDAAREVESTTSKTIINPLNTFVTSLVEQLEIKKKSVEN